MTKNQVREYFKEHDVRYSGNEKVMYVAAPYQVLYAYLEPKGFRIVY